MTTESESAQPARRRTRATRGRRAESEPVESTVPSESAAAVTTPLAGNALPRRLFSSPATVLREAPISASEEAATAAPPEESLEADTAKPHGRRAAARPRKAAAAKEPATEVAVLPAASVDAADAAALAAPAEAPTPRTRSRRRQPAASPAAEPGIEPRAPQPDAGPFAAPPAPDDDWAAAPATDEELAAIARAASGPTNLDAPVWPEDEDELITWSPADAQVADDAFVEAEPEASEGDAAEAIPARRRRRRGGRGRRGRGGQGVTAGGAEPNEPAVMETAVVAESPTESPPAARPARAPRTRQPSLPAYPVEFEPLPPPTKRKPARRPGDVAEPRFSRAEIAEFEQFVRGAPTETNGAAGATDSEIAATPLTPAEQEALRSATKAPPRRTRGTRGRASQSAESAATSGLQETPAFASLPAAPEIATGASGLETLLARQNLLLYTLMERQVALLRNIERSLIALDRRLATGAASATHERAGVFVDVPNVIYAAERFGCQIDFTRLLDFLVHDRGRELVRASAYAPVSDDPSARLELQKFVQPFVNRGYRIVTKPLKRFADGTMKGNFDVELAMDVLTMADRLDVVCLVSGDGDFRRLVELVASKGVRVEAIAFAQSTSSELKAACDEYIDLGLHLRQICGKVG